MSVINEVLVLIEGCNIKDINWDDKETVKRHLTLVKSIASNSPQVSLKIDFKGFSIDYKSLIVPKAKVLEIFGDMPGLIPLDMSQKVKKLSKAFDELKLKGLVTESTSTDEKLK